MAQVQVTVSMDSQRQQQIERYCALSGVSRESAFNKMIDIWERQIYLPWVVDFERKEKQREDEKWFDEMRARAERGETPDLTMEEIIQAIKQIREESKMMLSGW
ncbi:MAG: hypothetical protein J6X88_11920 [Bacteroidales bacterium]|nr:hypothetical protein [Bacteroidales bacterium]